MANWIITEDGNAVNLDMATQIIYSDDRVRAYFACPSDNCNFNIDCISLKTFDRDSEALEYIKGITTPGWVYKSEGHRLAEVLV